MLQSIASQPDVASAILAAGDWSDYIYLILIALSGLGALANKVIERFGGKKGAGDQSSTEKKARKYPPLGTKRSRRGSDPQSFPPPAPPASVARTREVPPPATRPVARPVARRAPSTAPAPPPRRRTVRPASPPEHKHATRKDLPSEIAEHVARRAAVKKRQAAPRRKAVPSEPVDVTPLPEATETSSRVPIGPRAIHGLTSRDELRRAILLREILGPPVALRDQDPWSV